MLPLSACDSEETRSEGQHHPHSEPPSEQTRSEQRSWALQPGLVTSCKVACGRDELRQCADFAPVSDDDNCEALCVQSWADVLDEKGDSRCGWASYNYLDCVLEQSCSDATQFSKPLLNPSATTPAAGSACAAPFRKMSEECSTPPAPSKSQCPADRARDDSDFLDCE